MDKQNVAYLINSTPKYYYLLELHVFLLKRYAPTLQWPIYLASENPNHIICKRLKEIYNIHIIPLEKEYNSFISSRKRAIELLPNSITYVLPMQEDFLLERFIDEESIKESIDILERNHQIISIRYMPCPGPNELNIPYSNKWKYISSIYDNYLFTFQATLWRKSDLLKWYSTLMNKIESYGYTDEKQLKDLEVNINIAENNEGQQLFNKLFSNKYFIGYIRNHKSPNAVYISPWPYRPTAIIKGVLQPFAKELALREGLEISHF